MDCSTLTGLHCWWKHLCLCTHTVAAHWQSGKVLLFPPAVNDTRRALSLYDRWLFPSTLVPLTGSCGQTAALEAAAVQLRITQQVTNTLPHSAASNFLHTHPPRAPGATGWKEAEHLTKACSRFAIFCCSGTPYPLKSLCSVLVLLKEDDFALPPNA